MMPLRKQTCAAFFFGVSSYCLSGWLKNFFFEACGCNCLWNCVMGCCGAICQVLSTHDQAAQKKLHPISGVQLRYSTNFLKKPVLFYLNQNLAPTLM